MFIIIKRIIAYIKRKLETQNIVQGELLLGKNTSMAGSNIEGKLFTGESCLIKNANMTGEITLGKYSSLWGPNINLNGIIHIGSYCSIASNTSFFEFNHDHKKITTYYIFKNLFKESQKETVTKGNIEIGSDVWIGAGCTILSGVKIGHGAVIASNSLINSNIPPYSIIGGVPAKIISTRFSEEVIDRLLEIKWWEWSIDKIKKNKELFSDELTLTKLNNIIS